jgi:hypothetical protein
MPLRVREALLVLSLAGVAAGCAAGKDQLKPSDAAGTGEQLSDNIHQQISGAEKVTEYDLNHDKKPDVWSYTVTVKDAEGRSVDRLVRKELDINWDGKVDISRYYDEHEQLVREVLDLDFDGKVDQTNFYEKGQIVRKERDLDYNGRPDLWVYYEKGKIVRKERDINGDGKPDYWEYWENDQVDRVGEDLDGDGNVDRWTRNPEAVSTDGK